MLLSLDLEFLKTCMGLLLVKLCDMVVVMFSCPLAAMLAAFPPLA